MRKRKSKYIKALAVVLSMMTIMAGLPIPATVGYSIGEEIMEPAAEQPEEVMEPETIAEETEIDESEEVLPDEGTETEQPQDEPPQEESPADAEGQTEIAPEAPTESVSPDEGVTEEIPENAPSEEYPLEEQPVEDDSVLIEESEETEEPTESAEEQPSDEVTEDTLPDELSAEEVMPEDDGVEAELEESTTDEILEYEHPVKTALLSSGYAYLMTERDVQVFASSDMQEVIFTISPNGILLVTAFIEQETNILEVQFMTASGETITGYVYADELPDNLLTSSDIDAAALVTNFSLVFVGDGKVAVFEVAGETYIPISTETPAEMEQPAESPEEDAPSELPVETPAEDDPFEQPEEPQLEDSPLEESSQSEETELPPAEDETMEEVPESDVHEEAPMMFASAPMLYASYPYGFSLRDHYGYTGYFYAGQTNVHGSSGDDSYPQLAASDEEGTIYATPHYLDGVVVYCLEHKYPGPGERDGDDDYEPTGPYTIVDLAGYKTTPGYSGNVFSDRTMHAIAWVIRHSYPFMVIDSYSSENENWSRAAGQFAIRQVIRELEGKEYVRSYWDLDDFYRRADSAPAEYLEYARWLAANAIAYGESAGTINVSNKSVSYSNGMCIGTVTVTTDAGQMRVSRSVGSMTGNSGGQDGSYYYLYSGDTVTVSAAGTGFTMTIETMASSDEEAYFLVGVSDERIQKVIIPQEGEPYPLASTSVSFEVPHGSVSVTKKDADPGKMLAGAVFELVSSSSVLQTVTTGSNGTATFSNVQPGSYTVREVSAPEGYRLAATSTQNVSVSIGQTASVTFTNEQKEVKIRIVKTDQLTGRPLAGVEFTITRLSAPPAAGNTGVGESVVITTDANGHAETGWLPYGRYRVEETGVPEDYVDNGLSVTVDAYEDGQTYSVEAQNEPVKGFIRLTKTDHLDGHPIAGVQFDIYYNDEYGTGPAGIMTTNENGIATSSPLRKGNYIVREHAEPTGYVTELVELESTVYPDETTDLTVTNQPIQGYIRIVKSDELTGEALAGAAFTITRVSGLPSHNGSNDGKVVAVITTDANGVATSPLLTWGTYRVTETGVPVHYVDNSFSVDVNVSEHMNTYEVAVENEPTKGWIRLVKTDRLNGNPIAGVQFDIYYNDQYGEGLAATMVTDENGVAVSQELRKGQYLIREHDATAGYYFEETVLQATVRSDETTELAVTNQPVMVQLKLYKRDKDEYTGNPADVPTVRGDGILTGAEFQVLAAENIVDRQGNIIHSKGDVVIDSIQTEGADASATTVELWPGLYEFIELTPPTGYQASSQRVQIDASGAARQCEVAVITYEGVITNEIRYGAQAIVKILGENSLESDPTRVETPEEGAEFAVYLKKAGSYADARDFERDYLITDERGYAMTKALPYGVYVLQQTAGEEGYEIKGPIVFEINGTESLINPPPLALNDKPILYRLRFVKVDSETGNPITLSNAAFKLKDADGQYVTQTVYYPREMELDTFTTDATGSVTLPETVGWGLYSIKEVTAPDGYLLSDEEIEIFVGSSGDTPGSIYELEIEIPNDPVKGRIVLNKTGSQLVGFESQTDDYGNEVHTPIFEEKPLAGAVFELRAAEDIVGGDGTVWYPAGEVIDSLTTSTDGENAFSDLPLGKYHLFELSAPDGYVFSTEPQAVELLYAGDQTVIAEAAVTISNAYLPTEIILRKEKQIIQTNSHADGTITRSVSVVPGEGFAFGLYCDSDIHFNGGTLMADTLIASGTTNENGLLTFSGCYPHGDYYIRELYAPDGWKISAERYPVSITPEGEAADAEIIRVEIPAAILNELIYSHVTLTKTDLTGANTLPGATIEVQDADGNVIFRDVTDENGEVADIPVTPGSYTFREVYAPEGYELSEDVFSFTVDENGHVTGDTVVRDDFTRFSILKHDEYGLPMEDVEFGLMDEVGTIIMRTLTAENGLATFEKVPYGSFRVVETKPLAGYVRSDLNVEVTVDGTFINPAEPLATVVNRMNEVLLHKVDQDGQPLAEATFGLYNEFGECIKLSTSDDSGRVSFRKIPFGRYTIREMEAPDGYLPSKEEISLTIDENHQNSEQPIATVVNQQKRVQYRKVDTSGNALAGVEFSLLNAVTLEVVETVTSNANGEFIFTQFDYGDWIIRETKAPEGFVPMEDVLLHVDENWTEPEPITLVNIPNHFWFFKSDHQKNALPGVTFGVEDTQGNILQEVVSDEDGVVYITDLLAGSYIIRELETVEGFTRSDEVIELVIDENYVVPEKLQRFVNYPTIETGVDLEMTPIAWAGVALVALAVGLILFGRKNSRKSKRK